MSSTKPGVDVAIRGDLVSQFKEAGLTMYEATTYATLLARWPLSASRLCEETGIPDTKIYHVLDSLHRKGMLMVQQGRPTLFKPLPPKEAMANLEKGIQEELNEKLRRLHLLKSKIQPLYEKSSGKEELELAYVIRGTSNIVNRMKGLLESAEREAVLFIPNEQIFESLRDSIIATKRRGVRVQLAVSSNLKPLLKTPAFLNFKTLTESCQTCWAVIKDNQVLLSVSGWRGDESSGILTQDSNLIAMCRSWLTNPSCCY